MINVEEELQLEGRDEQSRRVPRKTLGMPALGSAAGS